MNKKKSDMCHAFFFFKDNKKDRRKTKNEKRKLFDRCFFKMFKNANQINYFYYNYYLIPTGKPGRI